MLVTISYYNDYGEPQVYLDFSSSITINLRKALDDGVIETIGSFFEKIFQYAEKQTGNRSVRFDEEV